jgi:hypothetical protein
MFPAMPYQMLSPGLFRSRLCCCPGCVSWGSAGSSTPHCSNLPRGGHSQQSHATLRDACLQATVPVVSTGVSWHVSSPWLGGEPHGTAASLPQASSACHPFGLPPITPVVHQLLAAAARVHNAAAVCRALAGHVRRALQCCCPGVVVGGHIRGARGWLHGHKSSAIRPLCMPDIPCTACRGGE